MALHRGGAFKAVGLVLPDTSGPTRLCILAVAALIVIAPALVSPYHQSIFWGLDQIRADGKSRPPDQWRECFTHEDALRDAPPGQETGGGG